MTLTHLHLMLNHVPVLGTAFGLGLLAFGIWRQSDELKKAALGFFVIAALIAIPAYLTGEPAEEVVESLPGVSDTIIEQHEQAAVIAFTGIVALGVVALAGLFFLRRGKLVPAWFGIDDARLVIARQRTHGVDGKRGRAGSPHRDSPRR